MTCISKKSIAGKPGGSPTMADLARLADVSAITVSRALAGNPLVNPDTAAKIKALAREHGYAFNVNARNLHLRRSMTVAVVVEMKPSLERQMSGPYPLELPGGITQKLTSSGYSVLLTSLTMPPLPNVKAADGVILLGQGANEDAMHAVRQWGRPMVAWGAVSRHESEVVVGSDNCRGGAWWPRASWPWAVADRRSWATWPMANSPNASKASAKPCSDTDWSRCCRKPNG